MEVLLMGPPGCGKGTQGERIAERFGIQHIAVGDLLRAEVKGNTDLGDQARKFMDRGELVPDELIIEMVLPITTSAFQAGGFVLDGFPRSVFQAVEASRLFDVFLEELGTDRTGASAAIYLEAPRHVLIRRLLDRAQSEGRADDTAEVIAHRLSVFDEATLPLVDHYRERGRLRIVDATGTLGEVSAAIFRALGYPA
jgi:adenylate kinase